MKLSASLEYLSSGCNRSPGSVCWSNDAVAYGSSSNVVVYSSKLNKAILSLSGHRGRVNCVSWLKVVSRGSTRFQRSAEVLVSGSADNTVIVWKTNVEDGKLVAKLEGHTGPVTALATLLVISTKASDKMTLIATTSTDSSLRIWQQKNLGKFVQVQTIPFGRGFALSVDLAVLTECDGEVPFLVCGCDDSILHCYVWHGNEFNEVLALSGHGDWIRGVDMTVTGKTETVAFYLTNNESIGRLV
ncbi:elongator complex protein 2-like isoform X2 [Corticium candelabrum]|uniref:elongator complex protein 2-like isoform X2 n=1 Tax=Corticium candelabrum TaxID=121492 RepID=UPI002E26C495|nr:elongator complex protein 2-like isoform X2 [Corticium candelabrum]